MKRGHFSSRKLLLRDCGPWENLHIQTKQHGWGIVVLNDKWTAQHPKLVVDFEGGVCDRVWYLMDLEKEPRNNYFRPSPRSALWPQLVAMPVKPVVLLLLFSCSLVLVLQIALYRSDTRMSYTGIVGLGWCAHVASTHVILPWNMKC